MTDKEAREALEEKLSAHTKQIELRQCQNRNNNQHARGYLDVNGNDVVVKGKLGEWTQTLDPAISVKLEDGAITLERANEEKHQGFPRTLPFVDHCDWCYQGYEKKMEPVGVGYRAAVMGQQLELTLIPTSFSCCQTRSSAKQYQKEVRLQ